MNILTEHKRNYPILDRFISDNYTENTDLAKLDCSSLSLKSLLVNDPQGFLHIIDDNIEVIANGNYPNRKIESIISRMKNNVGGLINTASELGLMRYYCNKGWLEDFDYPYCLTEEKKGDFDIKIKGPNRSVLIDVLNFELKEYDFLLWGTANNAIHEKFYQKVIEKSKKKHILQLVKKNAIDSDYGIAIDWTKDHQISTETLITSIIYPETMKQKARLILDKMPYLKVVIFYNYDMRYHEAYNVVSQIRDS